MYAGDKDSVIRWLYHKGEHGYNGMYHMEEDRKKRWYFYREYDGVVTIDCEKEYAFLWNYPEDIKPDWLAEIEETKTLLREDGFDV